VADEFVFMGSVKDNAPYVTQKGRVDKRMIRTIQENFSINSGEEFVLLDSKERGDLYEIRIVSDNPYLEVFIEIDEWRNDNSSAAEILAQPETGRLLSNFQAIDGGHPGKGYTLIYNPDLPEDYDGRIRVILRNRIKPNSNVLGIETAYTSRGDLATPTELGYIGGFMVNLDSFANIDVQNNEDVAGMSIATNPYVEPLLNPGAANEIFTSARGLGITKGVLHPYIGIAGRPILSIDNTDGEAASSGTTQDVHVFFDKPIDGPSKRQNWPQVEQDIYIVDTLGGTLTTELTAGDRLYLKDGSRLYFPGVIGAVATNQTLPARFAKNGTGTYSGALKITVAPGMRAEPPPFILSRTGSTLNVGSNSMGSLTTAADTNPEVYVYRAEVKRLKRVSYDG
tara:strand:+ start:5545 stop:6732 length:1188 start_codon:yes stop_codon:yes gene_type:complete